MLTIRHTLKAVLRRGEILHADQRGSISITSVFSLILLVFLLGMVMNVGRQVDQKVKLQNAADASTLAGGLVFTRNMNTLAFTNHLLSDVFAITAYLREARDRNTESLVPGILDNWERVAPAFQGSEFPRFDELGYALEQKVPREREMVRTFSEWSFAAQEIMRPVFEAILAERQIPEFQRTLVLATPRQVQAATNEVARRHGNAWPRQASVYGVLWRTNGMPAAQVVEDEDPWQRLLPVVDPVLDVMPNQSEYFDRAVSQRRSLAEDYLRRWNNELLEAMDEYATLSQFGSIWRSFTCGYLNDLLDDEYPTTNLPFQIRTEQNQITNPTQHLQDYYSLVGVVYREPVGRWIPRIYRNPVPSERQAYAQCLVYVPRNRLRKIQPGGPPPLPTGIPGDTVGGIPGTVIEIPVVRASQRQQQPPGEPENPDEDEPLWWVAREGYSQAWNLLNQHWSLQLVPATSQQLPLILSTQPELEELPTFELADFSELTSDDWQWLNHH